MAERRMLTKKVTDEDRFMGLSSSAQALYLHLSMSADDDGFCNQVTICMFRAHASTQDLQALLENRYIYQFENGVIVIKHWRMANALRKDRYTPTIYQNEMKQLGLSNNGEYVMGNEPALGCQMVAERLPNGCQVVATGKDRLGKESIGKDNTTPTVEVVDDVDLWFGEFWELYPRKVAKANAVKAFKKKCKDEQTYTAIMRGLQNYVTACKGKDPQYIAHPATWINGERWNDEITSLTKSSNPFLDMLNDME